MRRAADTRGKSPRLVLRFAVYSAITIGLAGFAVLWYVDRNATSQAQDQVRFHAGFVADTILHDALTPKDFHTPVSGARLGQLDRMFRREILVGGVLRAKLYSPAGLITYSTQHNQIGVQANDSDPRTVFVNDASSVDVTRLGAEGGGGSNAKVLEAYVPVNLRAGRRGVFEIYQDYSPVAAAAQSMFLPIAGVLALVLLGLYAVLLPILRRVSNRLHRQVAEIEHQAFHDSLTGLPNRLLFRDRVDQAILAARREGATFAVLLIDLDRFKEVNDTLGHQSGDRVLDEVASRLRSVIRESDTVARLGGDEFALLARAGGGATDGLALAERIHSALRPPLELDGILLEVGTSIGIAIYPDHGDDADTLIRRADVAMYLAKELRTDSEMYKAEKDTYSPGRLRLVGELRKAIEEGEIVVHYQPQASAEGCELRGVEALARWEHPELGLLPPSEFIPLAEHTGLIHPLTLYVLDAAIAQCRQWHDEGLGLSVAVNITARDLLDDRFPDEVAGLLGKWGLEAGYLELEITENTILTDPVRARAVLARLSDLGLLLAIDDFGSGNSSLGYLKRLPVDVLKIDRAFVMNMSVDADDAVIVRSTIELGHNLGLKVVAEGVEDECALGQLAELRCDIVQGYYLGKPMSAASFALLLGELKTGAPV